MADPSTPIDAARRALLEGGLDSLFESILRPLILVAPDGEILAITNSARRLLGYWSEGRVGPKMMDSEWFQRAGNRTEGMQDALNEAAAGRVGHWSMPAPSPENPGQRFGICFTPVRGRDNRVTAVLVERDPLELAAAGATPVSAGQEMRLIVEAGRVVPGVYDVEYDRLWLHPLVYEVFQIPESEGGKRLADYLEKVHPDDRHSVREGLDRALASANEFKVEFRLASPAGTEAWWAAQGVVQRLPGGGPARIAGLAIDITQRRLAEQALRESEERFRTIFERSTAGIALFAPDGRFLNGNPAFCQMLGHTEQELQEKRGPEMVHPSHRSLVQEYIDHALAGDAPAVQVDRPMLRADGATIWVRISGGPLRKGNEIAAYIVVAQDITSERQALEAVQESESRFRALADTSPAMLWMADSDDRMTFVNQAVVDFLGGSAATVAGLAEWIHPEERDAVLEVLAAAMLKGNEFRREFRVRRHDGVYRWLMVLGLPRVSPAGKYLGLGGSAIDVTDRLETEQSLRAELEHRTQMERELHALSERLIQAQEQTRRDIARELHDDLGQRVAAQGYALFNLKRRLGELTPEAQEAITRLEDNISKLGADIRRLSHRLHPATLEHAGLGAALRALASELTASGLRVTMEMEGEVSLPPETEVSLFRFVQEALQNVVRHSGVSQAEVQLSQDEGWTRLKVCDRGVGFNPEAPGRPGLGLISMRERARLLRGALTIVSAPDQGTTVLLELPSV